MLSRRCEDQNEGKALRQSLTLSLHHIAAFLNWDSTTKFLRLNGQKDLPKLRLSKTKLLICHISQKPELKHTKDFEAKYNKVKAKLALLSSSASAPKSSSGKNKGLIAKTYEWDEEEMSSDEETEVKALMELVDEERDTLLEMEDNDDRKSFLDYFCIDLNYVEEQRNNLLSKHINLVQKLNTCKEQLLISKQAKLDLFTMQHVNTEILKENQNLRNELKELTFITET
ncbi:hypothetical protein Tco_0117946 [Tanacetum coccineum]